MALKYKRILLKLSGEVLKGSSDSCHDETILAEVAQPFDAREAIRLMGQGTVALFAGDTGNPFFSTDSGAALRAAEIGADALLKATKVDGIYSADPATGRIAESDGFAWDYLAGSNLKSKLTYPNGATASWDYEANRDLLTKVTNAHADGTGISSYTYTNDLLGRRTAKNDEQYGYNIRDELIAADDVSYAYDDIGNRTTAEDKAYTANNLNQYTTIDDFTPQYDADGNQTLIKTPTGIWSVTYNAENRPVRWTRDDTIVTMTFDRLGRRVDYYETRAGQVATHFRFVYDNFLCVQRLNAANGNAVRTEFVWDPTEPIATRPLIMRAKNWGLNLFYTHDGNKNVSEVFYHALQNGIAAHYDYAPFGAVSRTSRATRVTNRDVLAENPFRFSSEYHDETLMLVYYNYRMLSLLNGRWTSRERNEENERRNLYLLLLNSTLTEFDYLGDSRQPSMPKTFPVYPYPSLSELQKYSCGLQYIEGPRQTLPEGECCISDLDGTYSITFVGESYPDPKPTVIQKSDGTTHFIHRRLRIGAVCIQKIVRLCLSPRTYQLNTYLIDGKSGIWEESELENAKIEF